MELTGYSHFVQLAESLQWDEKEVDLSADIEAWGKITDDEREQLLGLIAGFCVGYVAGIPARSSYTRETMWRSLAVVCVALTVYSFWLMYRNFPRPGQL